ncbi:MAG: hypothetical protein IT168_00575 [Bryobacterales bacterium]|nr:hypothetical protein [Bryobacterales bacterium]
MAFTSAYTSLQCVLSQCRGVPVVNSTLVTPAGRRQFDQYVQVSRNGRYAFIGVANGLVLDLTNGEYRRVPGQVAAKRRALSDTGCAVTLPKGAVTLNCPSGERSFPVEATVRLAQVDAEAKRIVYQSAVEPSSRVPLQFSFRAIDLATGQDFLIAQEAIPADGISIVPELDQWSLTADGSRILYLAGEGSPVSSLQLFTIGTLGEGRRQLTNSEEYADGFWEAALSPDGFVAYGISADNRVVRIDVHSGDSVDIVPRTPLPIWVTLADGLVPGSRATMIGSTLTDKPSPPQADAHVVLKLNGDEIPILEAKPESITFQVPFETLPGEARLEVIHASPFHLELPAIKVLPWRVEFLLPGGRGTAIHQDFRSLVTNVDPAVPGEILHFYITGLA